MHSDVLIAVVPNDCIVTPTRVEPRMDIGIDVVQLDLLNAVNHISTRVMTPAETAS